MTHFEQIFSSLKAGDQLSIKFKEKIKYGDQDRFNKGKTYNGIITAGGMAIQIFQEISGEHKTASYLKDDFTKLINPGELDYCTIVDCDSSAVKRPSSEGGTNIFVNFTSLMDGESLSEDTDSISPIGTPGNLKLDIQPLPGKSPHGPWDAPTKKNIESWKYYPDYVEDDKRYEITVPAVTEGGQPITEFPDFSSATDKKLAEKNYLAEIKTKMALDGLQALLSFYNKRCTVNYVERKAKDFVLQNNLHILTTGVVASGAPGEPLIGRLSINGDAFDAIPTNVQEGCLVDGQNAQSWFTLDQNSLRLIGQAREVLEQYDKEIDKFTSLDGSVNINLKEEIEKIDKVIDPKVGFFFQFLSLRNQGGSGLVKERPIDGMREKGFQGAFKKIQDGKLRLVIGLDSLGKIACVRLQGTPKHLEIDHLLTAEEKEFFAVEDRPGEAAIWLRVGIPLLRGSISERTIGYIYHSLVTPAPPKKLNFVQDARENKDKGFEAILPKYTRGPELVITRSKWPSYPRTVDDSRRPLNRTPPPTREEIIKTLMEAERKVDDTSDGAWQAMVSGLGRAAEFMEDAEDVYYRVLNYLGIKQLIYELIACLTEDLPFNLSAEALCKSFFKKTLGAATGGNYAGNFTELILPLLPKEAQDEFLKQGLAGSIGNMGRPGGPTLNTTISALPGTNDPGPGAKGSITTLFDETPSGAGEFSNMAYSGPGVTGSDIRKQKQNIDIWIKKIEKMLDWEQLCQDLVGMIPSLAGLASGFGTGGRTARPSSMLEGSANFLSGDYWKQKFGKPPTISFNKLFPTRDYMRILSKQIVLGIEKAVTDELKKYVQGVFQYWIEKCRAEDDPALENQSAEDTGFDLDSLDTKAAGLSAGIPSSAIPEDFAQTILSSLNAKELCFLLNGNAANPLKAKALNLITSNTEKFGTLSLAITIDNISEFFVSMATPAALNSCNTLPPPGQTVIKATDLCGVEDPCVSQISLINSLRDKNIPDKIIQEQCRLDTEQRKQLLEELLDLVNSEDFVNSILANVIPANPCADLYPKDLPFLQHQQRVAIEGVLEPLKIAADTDLDEYPSLLLFGGEGPATGDVDDETGDLFEPPEPEEGMPGLTTTTSDENNALLDGLKTIFTFIPKAVLNIVFGSVQNTRNKYKADIYERSKMFQTRKAGQTPLAGLQNSFKNGDNFIIGSKATQDEELIGYETVFDPQTGEELPDPVPVYQTFLEHYVTAINSSESGGKRRRASFINRASEEVSSPNSDNYYFEVAPATSQFEDPKNKIFSILYNKKLSPVDLDFYDVEKEAVHFQSYGSVLFQKFLNQNNKSFLNPALSSQALEDIQEELKGRVYNDFFLQVFRLFINNIGNSELFNPALLQKIDWTGAVDLDCYGIPIEDYINKTDLLGLNSVMNKINQVYGSIMCKPDVESDMSSFRTAIFFGVVRLTIRTSIIEYFLKNIFSITQLPAADVFNKDWAVERIISLVFSNLKKLSSSSKTAGVTYYDSFVKSLYAMAKNEPSLLQDYKDKITKKIELASEAGDIKEVSRLEKLSIKPPPYQIIASLVQDQVQDVQRSLNFILEKLGPEFSIPEDSERLFLDMIFNDMVKNFMGSPGYIQLDPGYNATWSESTAMWFDLLPSDIETTLGAGLKGYFPEADQKEQTLPEITQTSRFSGENKDLYKKYYRYGGFILEPFMAYETKPQAGDLITEIPEQLRSGFIDIHPEGNIKFASSPAVAGTPDDGNYQSDVGICSVEIAALLPQPQLETPSIKTVERPVGAVNPALFHQWCSSKNLIMPTDSPFGVTDDLGLTSYGENVNVTQNDIIDAQKWKSVAEKWLTDLYDIMKLDPLTGIEHAPVPYSSSPYLDPGQGQGGTPIDVYAKWGPFWNLAKHVSFLSAPSWRVGPNKVGFSYGTEDINEPPVTEMLSNFMLDYVMASGAAYADTGSDAVDAFKDFTNKLRKALYKGDATIENIMIPFRYVSGPAHGGAADSFDFIFPPSKLRFSDEAEPLPGTPYMGAAQKQSKITSGADASVYAVGDGGADSVPPLDLTDFWWGSSATAGLPVNIELKDAGGKQVYVKMENSVRNWYTKMGTQPGHDVAGARAHWGELPEFTDEYYKNLIGSVSDPSAESTGILSEALQEGSGMPFKLDVAGQGFHINTNWAPAGDDDAGANISQPWIQISKRFNSCDTWLLDHISAMIGIVENTEGVASAPGGSQNFGGENFDKVVYEAAAAAGLVDVGEDGQPITGINVLNDLLLQAFDESGPAGLFDNALQEQLILLHGLEAARWNQVYAVLFRQGAAEALYTRAAKTPHPGALGGGQHGTPASAMMYAPEIEGLLANGSGVAIPNGLGPAYWITPGPYADVLSSGGDTGGWPSPWTGVLVTARNKDFLAWLRRGYKSGAGANIGVAPVVPPGGSESYPSIDAESNRWSQEALEKNGISWIVDSGPGWWRAGGAASDTYRANMHPASTLAHLYYWRDQLIYVAALRWKYYDEWLVAYEGYIPDFFGPFKYGLRLSYIVGSDSKSLDDQNIHSAVLNANTFDKSTGRKLKIGSLSESASDGEDPAHSFSIPLVEAMLPRPYSWLWPSGGGAPEMLEETFEELKAKILASEEFRILFRECIPIKELIVPMAGLFASSTNPDLGRLEQVLYRTKQNLKSLFFALKQGGNFDYADPDTRRYGGNAGLLKKMSNQVDTTEMPDFPNLFLIALNTVPLIVKGVVETLDPAWMAFGFMKMFGVKKPDPKDLHGPGIPLTEDDTIFDPQIIIEFPPPFPDLPIPYLLPIATNIGIAWAAWLEVTGWKSPRRRRDEKLSDNLDNCGNVNVVQIGGELFEQVAEEE